MARSGQIVPLIILFVVVGILLVIGFVAYSIATEVANKSKETMEKKHIHLTKDGMRVDVKSVDAEKEGDKTQRSVRLANTSLDCANLYTVC